MNDHAAEKLLYKKIRDEEYSVQKKGGGIRVVLSEWEGGRRGE